MPLTHEQAQADYLLARDALESISRSSKATESQKRAARAARDELDNAFIDTYLATLAERTAQYQRFAASMESVVDSIAADALTRGLRQLTEIVVAAEPLLNEA
jgi:hypothetical protein